MKHWGIDRINQINKFMSDRTFLRRFASKRIDTSDAVKKFYIEDGIAFISCNVGSYKEVIDKYSVKGYEWPNSDFLRFVEDNAYFIPTDYPLVLEICGTQFTDKQKKVIEGTLKDYYALKLGDAKVEIANTTMKWTCLFLLTILSAIILVVYKMLFTQEGLLLEILLVIFWFFLWEWGDVFAFERGHTRVEKLIAEHLASMKIIFSDHFVDEPVDEDLKAEILQQEPADAGVKESEVQESKVQGSILQNTKSRSDPSDNQSFEGTYSF